VIWWMRACAVVCVMAVLSNTAYLIAGGAEWPAAVVGIVLSTLILAAYRWWLSLRQRDGEQR
jgi:hypothetical protein